jgi:integrase
MSRHLARNWWKKAERLAGLPPMKGRGWHSVRHKFASDYWHNPPKVVADLGGWKDTRTLEMCYQHPDQDQLREALKGRRKASNQS